MNESNETEKKLSFIRNNKKKEYKDLPPKINDETLTDKEVKCCTGFKTKAIMYAYIVIICNGDHEIVAQTRSSLTWLEE